MSLEIRPLVLNGLHQAYQVSLICSTAPKPWLEASHSMTNRSVKSGSTSTSAVVSVVFSAWKADGASFDHRYLPLQSRVVSGAAMVLQSRTNLR